MDAACRGRVRSRIDGCGMKRDRNFKSGQSNSDSLNVP